MIQKNSTGSIDLAAASNVNLPVPMLCVGVHICSDVQELTRLRLSLLSILLEFIIMLCVNVLGMLVYAIRI